MQCAATLTTNQTLLNDDNDDILTLSLSELTLKLGE